MQFPLRKYMKIFLRFPVILFATYIEKIHNVISVWEINAYFRYKFIYYRKINKEIKNP